MSFDQSRHYAEGPLTRLLQRELSMLAPILDGVFGVWGLHLRPHVAAPSTLPPHLLSEIVELALDPDHGLTGDARCEPLQLPFASESFKLVVAQHVLERTGSPGEAAQELARVLAPEGVALVFGFNPASLWRPWLLRRIPEELNFRPAGSWRDTLMRAGLDVLQVRYSGLWSPWAATATASGENAAPPWPRALGRFCGSWLLLARKRRSSLTPLRLAAIRPDLKLKPSLIPGARRECA
jgi:SAM-dependent methyltransferase